MCFALRCPCLVRLLVPYPILRLLLLYVVPSLPLSLVACLCCGSGRTVGRFARICRHLNIYTHIYPLGRVWPHLLVTWQSVPCITTRAAGICPPCNGTRCAPLSFTVCLYIFLRTRPLSWFKGMSLPSYHPLKLTSTEWVCLYANPSSCSHLTCAAAQVSCSLSASSSSGLRGLSVGESFSFFAMRSCTSA